MVCVLSPNFLRIPWKTAALEAHVQVAEMRSQSLKPDLGDWSPCSSVSPPQSSRTLCLTWKTSTEIGHRNTECDEELTEAGPNKDKFAFWVQATTADGAGVS